MKQQTVVVENLSKHFGAVTAVDIYQSLIINHARLTYAAVARFLDEGDEGAVPAATHDGVTWG